MCVCCIVGLLFILQKARSSMPTDQLQPDTDCQLVQELSEQTTANEPGVGKSHNWQELQAQRQERIGKFLLYLEQKDDDRIDRLLQSQDNRDEATAYNQQWQALKFYPGLRSARKIFYRLYYRSLLVRSLRHLHSNNSDAATVEGAMLANSPSLCCYTRRLNYDAGVFSQSQRVKYVIL